MRSRPFTFRLNNGAPVPVLAEFRLRDDARATMTGKAIARAAGCRVTVYRGSEVLTRSGAAPIVGEVTA